MSEDFIATIYALTCLLVATFYCAYLWYRASQGYHLGRQIRDYKDELKAIEETMRNYYEGGSKL